MPVPPVQPAPARPKKEPTGLLGWTILFLCCVAMIGQRLLEDQGPVPGPSKRASAVGASANPGDSPSVQLQLVGRCLVGLKLMGGAAPAPKSSAANAAIGNLSDAAKTNLDKLRAAMVEGELSGPDAARKELDDLEADKDLADDLKTDAGIVRKLLEGDSAAASSATPEERKRLTDRHRWFAKVALTRGLPSSDPLRAEVESSARNSMTVLGVFAFTAISGMLVGFALMVVAIIRLAIGSAKRRFNPRPDMPRRHRVALLEGAAMMLSGFLIIPYIAGFVQNVTGLNLGWAMIWLVLPLGLWPLARGMSFAELRSAIGWHTGAGWNTPVNVLREIGCGIAGFVAGLPIVLVGLLITATLVVVTKASPSHPAVEKTGDLKSAWDGARLLLLACVWAPVVEETLFRGLLYTYLRGWLGCFLSSLIVAFIFAAIHPQGWSFVPVLMSVAVVLAFLREWRGSIIASMTGHCMLNLTEMGMLILAMSM